MRTTLDYLPKYLNNAAAASPGGVQDNTTGLRISTGTNSGDFIELTDVQAAQLSSNGLGVSILTAGSGQTNGTYTANASYGPAILNYTVAGGAVTAVSVSNSNGIYTPAFVTANGGSAPTFTIAAGGTPGTVQAILLTLYTGVYQRVKLTSTITSVLIGQAVFWNYADTTDPYAVTNVSAAGLSYAGTVIDPLWGTTPANSAQLSYAWIQVNGRQTALAAAAVSIGGTIGYPITSTNQYIASGGTYANFAGIARTAAAATANTFILENRVPQLRF